MKQLAVFLLPLDIIFILISFTLLGENPQEGSNQHSVTPHDNIKESSESHDSSSTNPEEDQSSGQAFASFACHSAGDCKLCACG